MQRLKLHRFIYICIVIVFVNTIISIIIVVVVVGPLLVINAASIMAVSINR